MHFPLAAGGRSATQWGQDSVHVLSEVHLCIMMINLRRKSGLCKLLSLH